MRSVSYMFPHDLEAVQDTVQFERMLKIPDKTSIRLVLEVPESQSHEVTLTMDQLLRKKANPQ